MALNPSAPASQSAEDRSANRQGRQHRIGQAHISGTVFGRAELQNDVERGGVVSRQIGPEEDKRQQQPERDCTPDRRGRRHRPALRVTLPAATLSTLSEFHRRHAAHNQRAERRKYDEERRSRQAPSCGRHDPPAVPTADATPPAMPTRTAVRRPTPRPSSAEQFNAVDGEETGAHPSRKFTRDLLIR